MRSFTEDFWLESPADLSQALQMLATGEYRPFSGGTDLMVLYEAGKLPAGKFLSLHGFNELKGIQVSADSIKIGALATYTDIRESLVINQEFKLLVEAARQTGAIAIQNRGTLGGNIANASPAADTPPALLCYDTQLELLSVGGKRSVDYKKFHLGYKKTDLQSGEIISAIILKRNHGFTKSYYRKVGTRLAQAISKVCLSANAKPSGSGFEFRLAFGAVAPVTCRALETEKLLHGQKISSKIIKQAQEYLKKEINPIDDIRSDRGYRLEVASNLLAEFLRSL